MRDTTVFPIGMGVTPGPEPEDDPKPEAIEIVVTEGGMLPMANPQTGEPLVFPVGQLRIPVNRERGLALAEALKTECEKLPAESGLLKASDLGDAKRLAELEKRLKG